MNYGIQMKKVRLSNNMTQKDIASFLNISSITYSHYETQDCIIPLKHLNVFCNHFNVSIDYIFNFTEEKQYKDTTKEVNMKTAGLCLKNFRKTNKITQDKIAKLVNTNRSVIANYERGRNYIATPFLYTICKTYNISADYLLGKINYNPITK